MAGRRHARLIGVLWTRRDALIAGAAAILGTALLIGGWFGAAVQERVGGQLGYGAGSVVGLMILFAGGAGWVVSARQRIGIRALGLLGVPSTASEPPMLAPAAVAIASPLLHRYHRPGCPLAQGRDVQAAPRADHDAAGRAPCGICRP